jgi:hypothetical protein
MLALSTAPDKPGLSPGSGIVEALENAVPGQHEAKALLAQEYAVFSEPGDPSGKPVLAARPVLLAGNHPEELPVRLARSLAEEASLPLLEIHPADGFTLNQTLAKLRRASGGASSDAGKLGVVLCSGLESLSPHGAAVFARLLGSRDPIAVTDIRGDSHEHLASDVFWIGAFSVPLPARRRPAPGDGQVFVAVADGDGGVVTASVPAGAPNDESSQAKTLDLLATGAFPVQAWLLPYTEDDLTAFLREKNASWAPAAPLDEFCRSHGTSLVIKTEAAAIIAGQVFQEGGGLQALHETLREIVAPVLPVIVRGTVRELEITADAALFREPPRLNHGAGRDAQTLTGVIKGKAKEVVRPRRTASSNPEVRMARLDDLTGIYSPPTVPPNDAPRE